MAFPNSGLIKIFPASTQIVSGQFALNSDAAPQPNRPVADIDAYYATRVANAAIAPNIRRATEYPAASGVYVPAISNFELQFSSSSVGFEFYDGGYPGPVVATTDFIKANFPMGMVVSQLQLWVNTQTLFGPNRDRTLDTIKFKYFGANFYTYIGAVGLLNGTIASPTSGASAIIPNAFTGWSIVQALKAFGVEIDVAAAVSASLGTPRSVLTEVFLLGAYDTQQFTITNDNPDILPDNISKLHSPQRILTIFDPDLFQVYWDAQDGDVESTDFPGMTGGVYIPQSHIYTFNSEFLEFKMPGHLGIPYGGRRLMLVGTSISAFFVGSFPLQNYNVTLVDGSGLYVLTPDKRNDTYYDRSTVPVTTVDLRIADPFVKTGFFNG